MGKTIRLCLRSSLRFCLHVSLSGIALLLLLWSPAARADTFQFDYSRPRIGLFDPVEFVFTITGASLPTSGYVTSFTSTTDPLILAFSWNSSATGDCFGDLNLSPYACAGYSEGTSAGVDQFAAGSFLSPGTFNSIGDYVTIVVTDLTTSPGGSGGSGGSTVPEPLSLLLLGSGLIGLVGLKKIIG